MGILKFQWFSPFSVISPPLTSFLPLPLETPPPITFMTCVCVHDPLSLIVVPLWTWVLGYQLEREQGMSCYTPEENDILPASNCSQEGHCKPLPQVLVRCWQAQSSVGKRRCYELQLSQVYYILFMCVCLHMCSLTCMWRSEDHLLSGDNLESGLSLLRVGPRWPGSFPAEPSCWLTFYFFFSY